MGNYPKVPLELGPPHHVPLPLKYIPCKLQEPVSEQPITVSGCGPEDKLTTLTRMASVSEVSVPVMEF